jgi:multiple sugar transport system ATP-binding protein
MRVRLENIHKSFGNVEVVKGLDLEVADGEFLVLLGASGSGKTTALRMIAGLESVTSGRIKIGDRDVTDVLPKYRDVAMVFQSYALYPHMTVFANIAYPLTVRGQPKAMVATAVQDVARQVQLDQLLDRYPRQLSGGQRQRVALARAMIRRPAAFLMDEPLSNLDAKLRGYMRAELKHTQHQLGITTIYVTHDQIEAMTLAHRVALLEKGVLQQIDTPAHIYNAPANLFVAGFIGSPPMNLIEGALAGGRFSTAAGSFASASRATCRTAVAGVRPEDCKVTESGGGKIVGEVYATELMGDHTLVTCRVDGGTMTVKTGKAFDRREGEAIGVDFDNAAVHLFDKASGDRIDSSSAGSETPHINGDER